MWLLYCKLCIGSKSINNQPSGRKVFFIPFSKNNLYLWSIFARRLMNSTKTLKVKGFVFQERSTAKQ